MKTPQEQAEHPPTECCNYSAPITIPYPVMWNEFNKVVQCHNCGHVWVPKCPELIAIAQAVNKWNKCETSEQSYELVREILSSLDALRAMGKVEL